MPEFIAKLDLEAAALLVESHASDAQTLSDQCEQVMSALQSYHIIESVPFTSESKTVATLWGIRKGMFQRWGCTRSGYYGHHRRCGLSGRKPRGWRARSASPV